MDTTCGSSEAKLEIKDLLEELTEENQRLLDALRVSQRWIQLCLTYRQFVDQWFSRCTCDESVPQRQTFDGLEGEYNCLLADKTLEDVVCRPQQKTGPKQKLKTEKKRDIKVTTLLALKGNIKTDEEDNQKNTSLTDESFQSVVTSLSDPNLDVGLDSMEDTKNGLKRSKRRDFISPKPIYEVKSVTNEGLSDEMDCHFAPEERSDGRRRPIVGYLCEYPNCDYENGSKGNVSRHISKMHLNKKPLLCDECGRMVWGQKRLFDHKKAFHFGNLIYNMNRKKYKCDWSGCAYECKSLTNMTQHKRRHVGDKPFKCPQHDCPSSFVTKSELKTHRISIHSNEFPFKCEWNGCGEAFKTKERLKYHSFAHTGQYPYQCEWPGCDAQFAKNADLKLHQLCTHSDVYPYACEWPECGKRFKTKNGRRLHNFTHTGERPFKCEWPGCDSSYYMISKLNRHKLTHYGIKRYVCTWSGCHMKYSTSHNLKLHLMVHRNERPFRCEFPLCQRSFTDRSQMKRHSMKVHKVMPQT